MWNYWKHFTRALLREFKKISLIICKWMQFVRMFTFVLIRIYVMDDEIFLEFFKYLYIFVKEISK